MKETVMLVLSLLVRWVLVTAAVALAAWVTPGVALEGGLLAGMWVALLIGLANVVVQPLAQLVPSGSPLVVLAVVALAVNGLAVWLASAITSHLAVDGFLPAVLAAVLISVFTVVLTLLVLRLIPDPSTGSSAGAGRAKLS